MYAIVKIGIERKEDSLLVPVDALVMERAGAFVYTITDNKAKEDPRANRVQRRHQRRDCQWSQTRATGNTRRQTVHERWSSRQGGGQMSCQFLQAFAPLCAFSVVIHLVLPLQAQPSASSTNVNTNNVYSIDLPTALRLANAQNSTFR